MEFYKFTGQERDAESNLAFFVTRHFSLTNGRFTSPDALLFSRLSDPQSRNLYAYTRNNPANLIDPDGRDWYYYNDAWHWHKGSKPVSYTDSAGKTQKATSKGTPKGCVEARDDQGNVVPKQCE